MVYMDVMLDVMLHKASKPLCMNTFHFLLFTCSMEAGKPGRPIEEETFGAVK